MVACTRSAACSILGSRALGVLAISLVSLPPVPPAAAYAYDIETALSLASLLQLRDLVGVSDAALFSDLLNDPLVVTAEGLRTPSLPIWNEVPGTT